ncbi:hypothetical protein D3C76_1081760 [compost metagenome]
MALEYSIIDPSAVCSKILFANSAACSEENKTLSFSFPELTPASLNNDSEFFCSAGIGFALESMATISLANRRLVSSL